MRLICPNCEAQYEVPETAIPEKGRDVQCSNCAHTWFQVPLDGPLTKAHPQPKAQDRVMDPVNTPPPMPRKPSIDPEVAEVLRQEAERERRAREQASIESQPELGLEDPPHPRTSQQDMDDFDLDEDLRKATARGRDVLPDIEEINSSLDSGKAIPPASEKSGPHPIQRKKSRRRGFFFGLLIVLSAAAVYIYHSEISAQIPQLTPYLETYVSQVDQGRMVLDQWFVQIRDWLAAQAAKASAS